MSRVLLTQSLDAPLFKGLQALLGIESDLGMVSNLDLAEFARCAQDAEVLINAYRPVNAELLQRAPHVRFVQQIGAGYDNLDLATLARRSILVANTPGANANAVAEHTVLLMLSLLKRFTQIEQEARANTWEQLVAVQAGIGDLETATVGLIGLGAIGRAVAQRLRGFGTSILYTTRRRLPANEEEALGVHYTSLPDLLSRSTLVSLHLPLTEHNRHMIGAAELALMRPDAFLINTSRGGLIDEQALRQAVLEQKLAGAGLDVLEQEQSGGNIFTDLPQVIVTPHMGGASAHAIRSVAIMAAENVKRFLQGEQPHHLLSTNQRS